MDEYIDAMKEEMVKGQEALLQNFTKVRTGRATPQLIDSISVMVASYGAAMPLNQLATVQAPDARMLVVSPWDKTTMHDIEKGIVAAGLGLNPSNDGKIIRVPVPPLTAERRQDLTRQVRKLVEDAKIRLRHIRREYNDVFKTAEKDGDISEDEMHRFLAKVQEATDAASVAIDEVGKNKEAEVLEV